jgi:hypothetical protein
MLRFLLLADAVPPAAETTLIGAITTGVAALVVALLRAFAKEKADARRQTIANLAHAAYLVTAEAAAMTETKIDDKVAHALEALAYALHDRGEAPPTRAEKQQAQFIWKAMHGAEKLSEQGILPP